MDDEHDKTSSEAENCEFQNDEHADSRNNQENEAEKVNKSEFLQSVVEAENSELIGTVVENEEEAYNLYNDYAFKVGFSTRRSKQRKRANQFEISMKQFCCSKAGVKNTTGKYFTKLNTRTGCKAMIRFSVSVKGIYTVTCHQMIHNHNLCAEDKLHLLRSQRKLSKDEADYLLKQVQNGVKLSDALRVLKKEKGGTPMVGFTARDAYNAIAEEKRKIIRLEGSDSAALLSILKKRQANEEDFYYDVEVDEENRLCSFFWRDAQMKKDYEQFGDVVFHDTTYRTNRYNMICGPFVGMNHHAQNVMFGCGFLLNETTESFIWLFRTFLESMGDVKPKTLMTDQSQAMAAAIITIVFQESTTHRLCIWHITENSRNHIGNLRALDGFMSMFNQVLKYCETEAEFEFYWKSLMQKYECEDNSWLIRLYNLRKKWCSALSTESFSGGALSSQRSEVTNRCISARLFATASLCDFHAAFLDVVRDWRSRENGEDFRCQDGDPEMIANNVNILSHARSIYTIEIYNLFQEQYLKAMTYHQTLQSSTPEQFVYHIGKPNCDLICHEVTYNVNEGSLICTCKQVLQKGILCSHILRIMNIHCIDKIPEQYILKRWTKQAISSHAAAGTSQEESMSVWRNQMTRKFNELIFSAHTNKKARECLELAYKQTKQSVDFELAYTAAENMAEQETQPEPEHSEVTNTSVIQNPKTAREKYQRNIRKKSTVEKITNIVRGRKVKAHRAKCHTKKTAQAMVQEKVNTMVPNGYLVHPTNGGPFLMPISTATADPTAPCSNTSFAMLQQTGQYPTFNPQCAPNGLPNNFPNHQYSYGMFAPPQFYYGPPFTNGNSSNQPL